MTLENQQTAENTQQKELNNPTGNDTAITNVTEISNFQDTNNVDTTELLPLTSNVSNIQNTTSESDKSNTLEQNLPAVSTQNNTALFEKDELNKDINEKKYKTFIYSLKEYGGQICNKIIKLANDSKIYSKGKVCKDIYENPIGLFRNTYQILKQENYNLLNDIKKAYQKVNIFDNATKQITLPLQIILGIMLKAYKDSISEDVFIKNIKDEKELSLSTCYNYISLTNIIDTIDDNRIFSIGLTNLYKLSSLIKDELFKKEHILKEIINMFYNLTNTNHALSNEVDQFTDDKFRLAVEYVIFYYDIGVNPKLEKKLFSDLYNARYEWTKSDVNFIKQQSIDTDTKGNYIKLTTYQYKLKKPEFINDYMKKLIENNFDGKLARKEMRVSSQSPTPPQKAKKASAKEHTIRWSTAHLTETIDKYISENKKANQKELEILKSLQEKLNIFITQNNTNSKGVTK